MKRAKKVLWGLAFLLAAALLIAGNFYDIRVSDILIMSAMTVLLIEGIIHRSFVLILFSAAIILIINSERLGIPEISPLSILTAALLGSIGLNVIFPHRGRHWGIPECFHGKEGIKMEKQEEIIQEGAEEEVRLENSFGETTKYFNGTMPRAVRLENNFGNMSVYFDNAVMKNHEAYVRAESSFGNMVLYIPAAWKVVLCRQSAFGSVKEKGQCNPDGEDILEIRAEASFGNIELKYI